MYNLCPVYLKSVSRHCEVSNSCIYITYIYMYVYIICILYVYMHTYTHVSVHLLEHLYLVDVMSHGGVNAN